MYETLVNDYIKLIKDHAERFPKTNIIITSRNIPGLTELQNNSFYSIKLKKFGDEQIDNQIEKRSFDNAKRIKERIENNVYLKQMASSPIMLVNMLSEMNTSPSDGSVVDFLELITKSIINLRWKDFDLMNNPVKHLRALLAGLAWEMLSTDENCIPKEDLQKQIERVYKDLEETGFIFEWKPDSITKTSEERFHLLTTDLGRRSGILNLDDNNTKYVFQDSLVKWYLGAYYVELLLSDSQDHRTMPMMEILVPLDKKLCHTPLKGEIVHALVMSISMIQLHQQQALLQYLLLRALCSVNDDEKRAINDGLIDLLKNTFGINGILNPREYHQSWEMPSVIQWLKNNGDTKTKQLLNKDYPEFAKKKH